MLSLATPSTGTPKATVNLLPCRVHHTGSANATAAHWSPSPSSSSSSSPPSSSSSSSTAKTAYFRGRRLLAKELLLPAEYTGTVPPLPLFLPGTNEGYIGCVLAPTDRVVAASGEEGEQEEVAEMVETKEVEVLATFDAIDVWGHEQIPDDGDSVVRAAEEWVALAARVNAFEGEEEEEEEGGAREEAGK